MTKNLPYERHHKPLLIKSRSWIQAIHKDRIFWKNLLKNKEMVFENGVKNIQAAAYNGARTVFQLNFENIQYSTFAITKWDVENMNINFYLIFSKKVKPKCLNNTKINAAAINFMDCRHFHSLYIWPSPIIFSVLFTSEKLFLETRIIFFQK